MIGERSTGGSNTCCAVTTSGPVAMRIWSMTASPASLGTGRVATQ